MIIFLVSGFGTAPTDLVAWVRSTACSSALVLQDTRSMLARCRRSRAAFGA